MSVERYRIMIVEDSRTQALRLQMDLEAQGWQVACFGNSEMALDVIERDPPHLILVDYCLPGIRGDEFCRRVRMNINTRGIPIIMLTSHEEGGTEILGLESGADSFVQKSADSEVLMLRIRAMLDKPSRSFSILGQAESFFHRARILAIDDSATYLQHLETLLNGEGYLVEGVDSGKKGIARLQAAKFDCVLVDLMMPEMDGIAVCKEIAIVRDRLQYPLTVLMLTGREGKSDLTRALEAGADDFVGKSSDEAVLKGRIRALLRRKFVHEENQRILEELKNKELEAATARAEVQAAMARAAQERQMQAESTAARLRIAKEQLERTNELLVKTNDELAQFASIASHDLQEPLRSMTSVCNLLQEEYVGRLDARADEYIELVVDGALRMRTLVRDLLSYCRLSLGPQFTPNEVGMDTVIEMAIANLKATIDETGAGIEWSAMPLVIGDRGQLVQLVQNLVGNAIKYRGDDPPKIQIDSHWDDDHWTFAVRDNGIGIDPEYRERVFEIFKRLHGSSTYPGTGIGLAICRRVVERHGGRIWVESQPGQGSVFWFTLSSLREENVDDFNRCHSVAS